MKNTISILFAIFFATNVYSQECTSCNETTNTGTNSSAIGTETVASGHSAFASGVQSEATESFTTALGFHAIASYTKGIAIGSMVVSDKYKAIVIGSGEKNAEVYLTSPEPNSLSVGFKSQYPTLFVSESTSSAYYDKTGSIGIGNVTDLQAKLHIRADDGEEAALLIEPNNWGAGEHAKLLLGTSSYFIKAENNFGIEFHSQNNFIFSGNNSGFGINEPKAKVHINGDLLFEQNMNGIIMKSEDGNCWKGIISNNGVLQFAQIDCETLTSIQNNKEQKHSEVFIYPNPTKGEITIEYTGNRKNLRVEFQTINGLLVATHKIKNGENKIELKNIPGQMIIASVYTKKGELISTNKVVIKR